jgi:outer membrane protein OmpA-like peptidoglycan-associated protein
MANLDVEPKKKSSILPWILAAIGLILLILLLTRGCNKDNDDAAAASADTTTSTTTATTPSAVADTSWNDVDLNAPRANYEEITDTNINVRGGSNYGVYGIGENILFDEGKATIRSSAEANLKQVAGSIQKRYGGGNVRIYGFTDATGSAGANKELAEQRAQAVQQWLVGNANMPGDRLSIHPIGEAQPVATNATEEGRQLNRRVEIVARGGSAQ